ncbi:PAS domain S-box-containing protein [Deinococcus metalli]|uniref:histidine kinase n=1 Tax=Deinococcus metalli TaxID=1141878 RepID=A0A7W8NSI2_9DEIO|nr:PAS domain-containing protein [Deinococcus metalli]MBB5378003.1 PAS domain S-box-containing protein [Deinococcus metalli]GHF53711.1 hypothetical protein GCM10017781_32420 [Deinococcus metalli]
MPDLGAPDEFTDELPPRQSRQEFLLNLSDKIRGERDGQSVARTAVTLLAGHLRLDRAYVAVVDQDRDAAEIGPEYRRPGLVPVEGTLTLSAFPEAFAQVEGHTLVLEDTDSDASLSELDRHSFGALGMRSLIVASARKGARRPVWALLVAMQTPRRWTSEEVALVEEVAERTWAAVERARAEDALHESEARYHALFASSPVPFMVLAPNPPDFTITAVNDAYLEAARTTRDALIGRRLFDVFTDDPERSGQLGPEALAQSLDRVLTSRRTDTMGRVRYDLATHGGGFEPHWWEAVNAPLFTASGAVAAILHQVTEVTDVHRAEEVLRQSQDRQAFLLRLSDALRAEASVDAVATRALALLTEQLRLDRCYVTHYHLDEDRADVTHQLGNERVSPLPDHFRLSDFPAAMRVVSDRTIVVDDDFERQGLSDEERRNSRALGMRAFMAATLRKGEGRPLWSMMAISASPRHWTPGDVTLLEEVAERTWVAMERVRTEAALQRSEEQYRTLFDTMTEGFALCGVIRDAAGHMVDLRYLALNRGLEQQTGLDRRAVEGRRFSEVVPRTDLDRWLPIYAAVVNSGEPKTFEEYVVLLDRWFAISAYPRPNDELALFYHDITERKQRELNRDVLLALTDELSRLSSEDELLHAVGARLADHLTLTCYHSVDVDEDRAEVTLSHFWHALDVPDIRGTYPIDGFMPPGGLARLRAGETIVINDVHSDLPGDTAADVALKSGADAQQIRAYVAVPSSQDGRWNAYFAAADSAPRRWTAAEIELIQEAANRLFPRIERARAEAAVHASQAQFRAVANLVPDLLWESRPDGFTTWYNDRWLEYTGQTFEVATGWGWTDAIHPEDREGSARRYREAVQSGQPLRQEHRIRRHDGEYRWFVVQAFPLRNNHGEVIQVYGAATDIHHLREHSAVLEARVEERTRRLADLNAELGNLIIRTAHNLEEPARKLGHLLDPGRPVDPHALDGLPPYDPAALAAEVTRLRAVAQDLRHLSGLETHDLRTDLLPLGEVFAGIQAHAAATARGAQVHWLIQSLPIIRGDRALLTQALEVLMTFTLSETRGAQYVTVSSQEVDGEVQVAVEDNGLGLSGEEAATLFDLAVRTDQAVPLLEGSGLVQVRRILARHGGWAWAEAQRSSGKVVLAFPRDPAVTEFEALFRKDKPGW